jgi:hypothetical protein
MPWQIIGTKERTVPALISRAYMCGLSTDQNTTPHIKRRENQRDTQLSVLVGPNYIGYRSTHTLLSILYLIKYNL